eukprot:742977-Amphidinium_carterae.1
MRKGSSKGKGKGRRKGKWKGKGFSGRPFFNPFQPKGGRKGASKSSSAIPGKGSPGPGQAQAHEAHDEEEDALAAKGKGTGKKKWNKNKKASAHEAEGTDLLPVQQSTSYQTSAAASGSTGPATGDTTGFCWLAYMSDGLVSLEQDPLFIIVDIGCTRAMCSRHAFEQLSREVMYTQGIHVGVEDHTVSFGFANSQRSISTQ